jgi:hypothetical protein
VFSVCDFFIRTAWNGDCADYPYLQSYGPMKTWGANQYGGSSAICMPGIWRQTASVVRFAVRYTENEKLLKILAVIAVCTYTVAHDRMNSLLVHCFVTVHYSEYASECEDCEVTGSQCLSQQVRRRIIMSVRTTRTNQDAEMRTHQNLVCLVFTLYLLDFM